MVLGKIQGIIRALQLRRRQATAESRDAAASRTIEVTPSAPTPRKTRQAATDLSVEDNDEEEKQEAERVLAEFISRMEQKQKLISLLAYHNILTRPAWMSLETIPEEEETIPQEEPFCPPRISVAHARTCISPIRTLLTIA
ncbi:hypothetical protein L7F22_038520 [Adiantum nelumboides]|nr:hypothetical protein [Adiantum nelumboides]